MSDTFVWPIECALPIVLLWYWSCAFYQGLDILCLSFPIEIWGGKSAGFVQRNVFLLWTNQRNGLLSSSVLAVCTFMSSVAQLAWVAAVPSAHPRSMRLCAHQVDGFISWNRGSSPSIKKKSHVCCKIQIFIRDPLPSLQLVIITAWHQYIALPNAKKVAA